MESTKILLSEPWVESVDSDGLNALRLLGDVRVASSPAENVLSEEAKDVDVLLVRAAKVTKRVIEAATKLRVIGRTGVGVDTIDMGTATDRGVFVINVPAVNADSVAEHTFCLILALKKNLMRLDRELRAGNSKIRDEILPFNHELRGGTLGVIGLGNIGRRVAKLGESFGMSVLAYDPYVTSIDPGLASTSLTDLHALLAKSDVVTCHIPLTRETTHLIGYEQLKSMKKTAFIINCSRGGIVDEGSLEMALDQGLIRGAGLDVFEKEFAVTPLYKRNNVIITPHIAGNTVESRKRAISSLVEDVSLTLRGMRPKNLVNPTVLQTRKA